MLLPRRCIPAQRFLRCWPAFAAAPVQRLGRVASSNIAAVTTIDNDALYALNIPDQLIFHSGFKLAQIPGKGRGAMCTADLEVGQLLAVLPATSILHGPVDQRPSYGELLEHVSTSLAAGRLSAQQSTALACLYDGSSESLQQVPDINMLAGASSSDSDSPNSIAAEKLPQIVALNAFGDQYDDLAAATVKDADPSSNIGLWPLFAMFNHSCAPNTIHYIVGSHMIIRAVQKVPEGEELTVSYLGREEFAPASVRSKHLLDTHGFMCACSRCASESRFSPQLSSTLQAIYDEVLQDVKPAYDAIKAQEEAEHEAAEAAASALQPWQQQEREQHKEQLRQQVAGNIIRLHEALKQEDFTGNPFGMAYAQAAVFDLLEAQSSNQPVGSSAALAASSTCISVLDAACRGAELHCMLAAKLLQDVMDKAGPEADAAQAAAQLCQIAHVARYGEVGEELMSELVQMHMYMAEEYVS